MKAQCPSPGQQFARAAYFAPVTWWMGTLNTAGMRGAFGDEKKRTSHVLHSYVAQALYPVVHTQEGKRLVLQVGWHVVHQAGPSTLGRLTGGFFVNSALTGGIRGGTKFFTWRTKLPAALLNMAIAGYGAGLLSATKGGRSASDVIATIMTGDPSVRHGIPSLADLASEIDDDEAIVALEALVEAAWVYLYFGEGAFQ